MIVDVNVSLGRWPFQRLAPATPGRLRHHLAREGIAEAWVSAVESVLHPDPDVTDEPLARRLRGHDGLHFVKTVNPLLAGAAEGLGRWVEAFGLRAVRLVPNYHQVSLADDRARAVMRQARRRRLAVLVQMRIEDERGQYPLMKVPGVPCDEVVRLARAFPRVPIVALCAYFREAAALAAAPNVHLDLSFMETLDTLASALAAVPARQIVFGSHTPFLCTRSAVLKLTAADIPARARRAIAAGNAARIFRAPRRR